SPTPTALVAPQCTDPDDERSEYPGIHHCFAESVMPARQLGIHQHGTADHERRSSDGAGQPLEVAADAASQGFYSRRLKPSQITFGETPQDAACVAGRITNQTLHIACQLAGFFLDLLNREMFGGQARDLFTKRSQVVMVRVELTDHRFKDHESARQQEKLAGIVDPVPA